MSVKLKDLPLTVIAVIKLIDAEMTKPSDNERGKSIARITNELEFINDQVLHFDLGYSFKKIEKLKSMIVNMKASKK